MATRNGPSSSSSGSSGSTSGTSQGSRSSAGSASTPSGSTPTAAATNSAAQLASDQASIDSDQANLVSAQQSLGNGTLKAPMAGTVAAVDVSVGQSVSAGSTSDAITITDPGSYQTTSSLTSSQVGEVATGDHVQVTIDGQSGILQRNRHPGRAGRSRLVRLHLPARGGPDARVVGPEHHRGRLDRPGSRGHRPGQRCCGHPTSAVHTSSAGRAYVITLKSGQEVETTVKVGVVGDTYTQITSGLSAGTEVVLANPSQPVPSSSSNSTNTFRGLGGTGGLPTGLPTGVPSFSRSSLG